MDARRRTEEKVFSYMEQHHMLEAHDRVAAGISGGADSVCLLFMLLEWAKRTPLSLAVVHVNHMIRAEAGQDADYVERLCKEHAIPFYPVNVDVRKKAREEGLSEEEAGRKARYEAFAQAAADFGAQKIAVAHNSNDRAETMLFHLFRGSGIRGLGSIRPVREQIIRPILCLERREAEEYLQERGIAFCMDATNQEDDYTRNRIRHHILPYAEKEIVAGCVGHMAQTADMLTDIEDYLEQQTLEAMQACVQRKAENSIGSIGIEVEAFLKLHKVIQQRLLYRTVLALAPQGKDISYVHIKDLGILFSEKGNRRVCLPFGIVGKRCYECVFLERNMEDCKAQLPEVRIEFVREEGSRQVMQVPAGDQGILELRLFPLKGDLGDFPQNQCTKWLDYDKIEQVLTLRGRHKGDFLTIAMGDGRTVHKPLKNYMITEKIPREDRDRIPLLADGSHVIWLMGYRISEHYKISRNTKRVLQVQLLGIDCKN